MALIKYRFILFFVICLILSQFSRAENKVFCESTKEFITSYEYLQKRSEFIGVLDNAVKVSLDVAKGCNGAAGRFINTLEALEKSELTRRDIVQTAVQFANQSEAAAKSFMTIFKYAYSQDGLDLNLKDSVGLSKSLSLESKTSPGIVENDFKKLVEFCLSKEGLDQSKSFCAQYVKSIMVKTDIFQVSVVDSFIDFYKTATDKNELNLVSKDAIDISAKLIQTHPEAFKNFLSAYRYAASDEGLRYKKQDALKLALTVAESSVLKVPAH